MDEKLMIPCLYLFGGQAVTGWGQKNLLGSGDVIKLTEFYRDNGADALLVFDFSSTDTEHDEAIGKIKEICQRAELPVMAAGNIKRMEDVKKLLYAGCSKVVLNYAKESNVALTEEVSLKFGKDKIAVSVSVLEEFTANKNLIENYASQVLALDNVQESLKACSDVPVILHTELGTESGVIDYLQTVQGISGTYVSRRDISLTNFKSKCRKAGLAVRLYESTIPWEAFKVNDQGMLPVIVQDCKTQEVLMLAYMNEEAYATTLRTGKMTYWSRSRNELWVKGRTSGHFQHVKSLTLDCDKDTILAKVSQIGAACHTGSKTCFFTPLMEKDYDDTNPQQVFQNVLDVILDRKEHPKEGSYTNYLFEKGLDKILKKVGEECTEIVIAAKNPDKEEIKYEISDFLYHVMVLMAEKGVSWEDITRELARR